MVYDPVKRKEYYEMNKEKYREHVVEYMTKRRENLNQHALDSIKNEEIVDLKKWDIWCNILKSKVKRYKYSNEFTNDIILAKLILGCFYCGDIATTIDRIDSKLDHFPDNCVGCCKGCNMSKGVADPSTFIRKAYYRARGKYYDDDIDIWFNNKNKPRWDVYKNNAQKKKVPFDLTREYFYILTKGECKYCHRSPTTWFGIDREIPSQGYVLGNVVSCCWDCNLDKLDDDIEKMMERNGRIAKRVDSGDLIVIECKRVGIHRHS